MKINREGIFFKYRGVEIKYNWPILRTYFYQPKYVVTNGDKPFNNLWSLKSYIDNPNTSASLAHKDKVKGVFYEDLIKMIGQTICMDCHCIILTDLNVNSKPASFWENVPRHYRKEFLKDVIFIQCESRKEMDRLMFSLPIDFCHAISFSNGKVIHDNKPD